MEFSARTIAFPASDGYLVYGYQSNGDFIVPPHYQPKSFEGCGRLILLPKKEGASFWITTEGSYRVRKSQLGRKTVIHFDKDFSYTQKDGRPAEDFFGNRIRLDFAEGELFERAYSAFYWDNLLPQIAERTYMRKKTDIRDGYVLSTLDTKAYAGTYPAVDHEFHIKGRFAVGGKLEKAVIRRMLLLQMKIMREDKRGLSRNVCSVQPSRKREYDVWRKSLDGSSKAQMFRITANIEFVEAMYEYYCMTKDLAFLKQHLEALEKNCAYIERFIDRDDLVVSHVHFEDQVIKNHKVMQSQLFCAACFGYMAEIEMLFARQEESARYHALSKRLGAAAVRTFPDGFWDAEKRRFIDWIDAAGRPHDHVHLLANILPEHFGFGSVEQWRDATAVLEKHQEVFQKFPSFVAAKIEDYTPAEIGNGGPYDLCAAGRYWCWDAAFSAKKRRGNRLFSQLKQVAEEAAANDFFMGERYDMNYIYYNHGKEGEKNWHGASLYYEYPNVFLHVLINLYLGVCYDFKNDLAVRPLLNAGTVRLEGYGIEYCVSEKGFEVCNLSTRTLSVLIDLSGIGIQTEQTVRLNSGERKLYPRQ